MSDQELLKKVENLTAHLAVDKQILAKGDQRVPFTITGELLKSRDGYYFFTNQRTATIAGLNRTVGETFQVSEDMNLRVKLAISDSRRKFAPRQPVGTSSPSNVAEAL